MKKMKKMVALMLTAVLVTGCLAGCAGQGTNSGAKNGQKEVEITAFVAGMGKEWIENVISAFNKKYPEYYAFYNSNASVAASMSAFGLEDVDSTDLYLTSPNTSTEYLTSLEDVLDYKVPGETKTIREKFNDSYLDLEKTSDGSIYTLTFSAGGLSFVYNKALFDKAGITQLPRTTDELVATCAVLYDKGITPLIHHKNGHYVMSYDEVFYSQAMGKEAFFDFYQNPTLEKFKEEGGRYDVLKAMEKLLQPQYVLNGSNTEDHTIQQTKFIEGKAAIMINGSWLQQEMHDDKGDAYASMKTPVLSSIKKRLENIKSDKDLRQIISAIDEVTDGNKSEEDYKDGENYTVDGISVTASDWNEIKIARNTYCSVDPTNACFIPTYSDNIEGAKEFLKFLYSDEGIKIHAETTHLPIPIELDNGELDVTTWTAFEQQQWKLRQDAEFIVACDRETWRAGELFNSGGAYISPASYVVLMCTRSEEQRKSAADFWEEYLSKIDSSYNGWLENIK